MRSAFAYTPPAWRVCPLPELLDIDIGGARAALAACVVDSFDCIIVSVCGIRVNEEPNFPIGALTLFFSFLV